MELSKNSQQFLDNLRLYLFSTGRNMDEINEVVEELEDHLREAEQNGKDIEHIIGQSPKSYMEMIASEMNVDYRGWFKLIPIFMVGVFAFILLGDAVRNDLNYSIIQLVGFPVVSLALLGATLFTYKFIAQKKRSTMKQYMILTTLGMVSIILFVGIIFLNRLYGTPLFYVNAMGTFVVASLAIVTLILVALWSKTWLPILVPIFLYVPEVVLNFFPLSEEVRLIVTQIIVFIGLGVYFFILLTKEKSTGKK
ncbi:HAAS domain-containing protein [Alkalihalobacterium sp. APHAB7]|uniref:HAAS domain-containing protein n=1 Tax=Alkalihalobacterium sp. APHAB7 TaxID=3402081 RepID=UPI003AAFBD8D